MMNTLFIFALIFGFGMTSLNAQNINIPDVNFKTYLVSEFDRNGDGEIQLSETVEYYGTLDCSNLNISDLTGIETFKLLSSLDCSSNNLTSLDLLGNTSLETINCSHNNLTSLILPIEHVYAHNMMVDCSYNKLTELDVSYMYLYDIIAKSNNLYSLDLGDKIPTGIDFTDNPNLHCIQVDDVAAATTYLTNIDPGTSFSTNCPTPPTFVNIPDANFKAYLVGNTAINTNGNEQIEASEAAAFGGTIDCSNLNIIELTGIETFIALTALNCSSNSLTHLNLIQNTNLTTFDARNNTNLTCIEVYDAAYSTTNWTNIDAGTSFSANCTPPVVNIPCSNLKLYLLNNAAINTNSDAEIQVSEAVAFTGTIDCSGSSIRDLTGIEAFVNLRALYCGFNHELFYVSTFSNVNLETLDCSNSYQLEGIFVGSSVKNLNCSGGSLYSLYLSQCTNLVNLNCSGNMISDLDLSQCTNLVNLNCFSTEIRSLDLSNNPNLEVVNCGSNWLNNIDIRNGNNTIITSFNALYCDVTCISVDDADYSTANWTNIDATTSFSIDCNAPPIIYVPNANFKAYLLGNAAINTNGDTSIQVTEADNFNGTMNCSSLSISNLRGLEAFVNLTGLDCSSNNLSNLNVSPNTNLTVLDCSNNRRLNHLNVKNGNNANFTAFNALNNIGINCIEVDDVAYSTTSWTNIDAGTSFSSICARVVMIPDANFKAYLVGNAAINTNGDTEIQVSEAVAFTGLINCPNLNIVDLTGVEAFLNLTELKCANNQISSLNLSQNTSLIWLDCSNNQLSNLDLAQNPSLKKIYCGSNQLVSLNVKSGNNSIITAFNVVNNPNLTCIEVDDIAYSTTNWTNIDAGTSFSTACSLLDPIVNIPDANFKAYLVGSLVSNTTINTNNDGEIQVSEALAFTGMINCPNLNIADLTGIEAFVNLTQLKCYNNTISSLDLTQNKELVVLHCVNNAINSLDLTQNTSLSWLYCSNNQLSNLDLTQNTSLKKIYCGSNQLVSLNVKSGNNPIITAFNAMNNPNLTCIEVDNATYSTANWINVDATASFDANCSMFAPVVMIPDANFKAYLVGNTAINTNGDAVIQVTEAAAFTGTINCSGLSIADLTGIEAFVNLTVLDCNSNNLSSLDLSKNTSLTALIGHTNSLSGLNIKNSNNTNFTTFDVTNNPNLACIEVDNATYSTANWINVDAIASFNANCSLFDPFVSIPDANFKAYLVGNTAINTNGDAGIHVTEAAAFTGTINCSSLSIADLTGIEAFVNLTVLDCNSNDLSSLDLSQNTSLTTLIGHANQLIRLNIKNSNNTNFTTFDVTNNVDLTCIEVDDATYSTANWTNIDAGTSFSTTCVAPIVNIPDANFKAYLVGNAGINTDGDAEIQILEALAFTGIINCPNLNISDLTGLEAFVNLKQLKCFNNQISSLDLSQNTELIVLHCVNNAISSLDLSQNTNLSWLYCSSNQLSSLDLTQNTGLKKLYCGSNQLINLNVKNGANTIITAFNAINNVNLICIEVDDATYSAANWSNRDTRARFSTNCSTPSTVVSISDANFKTYLLENTYINTNRDAEIQISEASAFAGTIYCPYKDIANLTGIEAFVNLKRLNCSGNNISSLDVSQNTSLIELYCYENNLSSLDLSQNTSLKRLSCYGNNLGSLDLSQNTSLSWLYCSSNNLSSLDVSQNTSLTELGCFKNNISSLDVSQNTSLTELGCFKNNISSLDVSQNTSLIFLDCSENNISSLDVSQNTSLIFLDCAGNNISSLDVSRSTDLIRLYCSENNLSSLDVTQNTNLQELYCSESNLSSLDVSRSTDLRYLDCSENNLSSLDVSQNTNLQELDCSESNLSSLDVSLNTNLRYLDCSENNLSSLDFSRNTSLQGLDCSENNLSSLNLKNSNHRRLSVINAINNPNLTCIEVDNASLATAYWQRYIDRIASFSTNCPVVAMAKPFNSNLAENGAKRAASLTGLNTIDKVVQLSIYPNPTAKNISLEFGKVYQEAIIQVRNLSGQIVLSTRLENSSSTRLELKGSRGIYFVSVQTEEGTATLKVIKN